MRKELVIAIGILVALPVISMAYENDEPNNDFQHATLLKETAKGTVSFEDTKDIYKFFVAKDLEIRLEVKANNDVDVYLYNPEQKGVAYSCGEFVEYIAYKADKTGYWYAEVVSTRGNADYTITLNLLVNQHDAGYDGDAGDRILKANPIFPMEPADDTPGRGKTGRLVPPSDTEDWYLFSVCEGQKIDITVTPESDFDIELLNDEAETVASSSNTGNSPETISYTADKTSEYYLRIYAKEDASAGNYTMDITLSGQNDAGSGRDAGNTPEQALKISPGEYSGFISYYDPVDWYAFDVSSGQGIIVELESPLQSDCNIWLYDPNGNLAYKAAYYGDDTLEYPANMAGTWKIKIDLFPGFDEKWDEYPVPIYKYGSGAYKFTLTIGGSVSPPPTIPQPDITPIAQTIIVNNDANSNKDEYAYIAAIPAANYVEDGKRYVSPVIYKGDDTITNWFGTVDDTTGYLLEDWNNYLANHGMVAKEYTLADDPVKAAADIATKAWSSSSEAVVVVDGSGVTDEVTEILSKETTLNIQKKVTQVMANSDKWKEFEGNTVYPMLIGKKWGIMHIDTEAHVDTFLICPNYMEGATDWWPFDHNRDDIWHPIILPGPYAVGIARQGDFPVIITLYSCDRYKVSIPSYDASLKVTVETDEPTYLWAYLIDSRGNIIAPDIPSWSGAEIPPYKIMPGNVSQGNEEEFDHLVVEPHTTFSFEAHHLIPGKYTIIVVPREDMSGSVNYRIKAELRTYSSDRLNYGLSAANGAVIASLKHIPLLYANEDGLPDETVNALSKLGVSNVIFVDLANNDAVANELAANYNVERITTMKDVVSKLQELGGEKYVTVTSFTTYDGYFAPAAYLAAYHGSPVVRIGEMGEAYYWGNVAHQWMFYAGDYYHGTRSIGHLPQARKPIMDYIKEGEIPPLGLDAELRWFRRVVEGVFNYANSIGVDTTGMEAYGFVAPKTDIRFTVHHALFGNESTAGQFLGKTAGELAAQVVRSVMYPAIIFGNPHRNITTSSLMNFQDGNQVTANNGERFNAYTSRYTALYFNLFGREYRGHCRWDNLYVDQNGGASLYYYSGHGTGGGGISYHPEFAGPDAWRGYAYWNGKTARSGGFTWYDVDPPNQYNLVHFKWADYYWENLHSQFVMWMSCTTFAHYGPEIYLEHGAVAAYGNANTGLSPHCEVYDMQFMKGCLYEGKPIGVAFSEIYWKFERDFTTLDPTSVYGSFALSLDADQVIYGDPMLYIYSPMHWVEPTPVESPL